MNERIRELAEQAEQYADDTMNSDPAKYDRPGQVKVWRELMQAKFAELIVRECMDIISDESEKVSDEWRCKDGKHIWWKIKDHFGVK